MHTFGAVAPRKRFKRVTRVTLSGDEGGDEMRAWLHEAAMRGQHQHRRCARNGVNAVVAALTLMAGEMREIFVAISHSYFNSEF